MSDNINIQEIIDKHTSLWSVKLPKYLHASYIAAFKEALEAVVDKCSEEVDYLEVYNPHISDIPKEAGQLITTYYNPNGADVGYYFDKQSILNVKNMIDYS